MTVLITSVRSLFQLAVFLIFVFAIGVTRGLSVSGPFGYLDAQITIQETMTEIQTDTLAALPESLQSFFTSVLEIATWLGMRGITFGYNAPTWVTPEFIAVAVGYIFLAAFLVIFRVWRYTTTVPLK